MKIIPKCSLVVLASAVTGLVFASGASANEDKMQMMDTNKDGMISATEHAAGARQMFQKMDANGDGKVTAEEMDAAHKQVSSSGTDGKGMSAADKIKTIDTDNDGVITAAEHEAGSRTMFTRMDTNGDGSLTSAEMQAGHEKMMGEQPR
jgi:Ca2+-binding EF-hand superfamily protein